MTVIFKKRFIDVMFRLNFFSEFGPIKIKTYLSQSQFYFHKLSFTFLNYDIKVRGQIINIKSEMAI